MAWRDQQFGGYSSDEDRYDEGYGNWGGYSNSNQRNFHYQHQQRNVKQVQRWGCGRCNKDYASKANLDRHMASEHAPKPKAIQQARGGQMVPWNQQSSNFVCRFCGNEYANQGNLNRHVSQTHGKGQVANVASSSKKTTNTVNIQYNIINQNFYSCNRKH